MTELYLANGKEWDLTTSMLGGANKQIFEEVEKLAFTTDHFKQYMRDPIHHNRYKSPALKRLAHEKVRNHFEYLQRLKRETQLDQEVQVQKKRGNAFKARLRSVGSKIIY